jgi:CCR4-NOT transcription complex subunit 7/8
MHQKSGIPHDLFAEHFMSSGLLFNQQIKWIAFNSAFDFAYMVKLLTS